MINFKASRIEIANSAGTIISSVRDNGPEDRNKALGSITIGHTPGDSRWVRAHSGKGYIDYLVDDDLGLPIASRTARSAKQQTVTIHPARGLKSGGTVVFRDDQGMIVREIRDGSTTAMAGSLIRDENATPGIARTSLPVDWRGTVEIRNPGQLPIFYSLAQGRLSKINLPPVTSLRPPSFYTDAKRSIIDVKKHEEYRKQIDPLLDALAFFNSGASQGGSPAQQLARARTVLGVLDQWASAKALTGPKARIDFKLRMWALSGIANAYARISKIPGAVTPAMDKKIKGWLRDLANDVRSDWNPRPGQFLNNANLGAWFGASMAIVGRVLDDETYGAVADEVLKQQVNSIARTAPGKPSGFLTDVTRGGKAWYYSTFGIEALLTIMQLRGTSSAWSWNGGALKTAVEKAIDGIADKSEFERVTRSRQDPWDVQKLYWLHMLPADLKMRAANLRKGGKPVVDFAKLSPFGRFQGGDVRKL